MTVRVTASSFILTSNVRRTRSTRKIQQAFGVNREMLSTILFHDLDLTIRPRDIVLICGPSGAGKTTLMSLIARSLRRPGDSRRGLVGTIQASRGITSQSLGPLDCRRPLIDALGPVDFDEALHALNVSGLAEAHLYVKRFPELSNGQRYRAMVAKLIASSADVWLADEFCATLDPITAQIVSRNLRRRAKEMGVTVIVAAANWAEFVHELRPDTIVHLRSPWDHSVLSWEKFKAALAKSRACGPVAQTQAPRTSTRKASNEGRTWETPRS